MNGHIPAPKIDDFGSHFEVSLVQRCSVSHVAIRHQCAGLESDFTIKSAAGKTGLFYWGIGGFASVGCCGGAAATDTDWTEFLMIYIRAGDTGLRWLAHLSHIDLFHDSHFFH